MNSWPERGVDYKIFKKFLVDINGEKSYIYGAAYRYLPGDGSVGMLTEPQWKWSTLREMDEWGYAILKTFHTEEDAEAAVIDFFVKMPGQNTLWEEL